MSVNIDKITTNREYNMVLKRIDEIFEENRNSHETEELARLIDIIEEYEDDKSPMDHPKPMDASDLRKEQMG